MILDERMTQELIDLKKSMESDGKLLSPEQLRQYYATFRSRFGPNILSDNHFYLNSLWGYYRLVNLGGRSSAFSALLLGISTP